MVNCGAMAAIWMPRRCEGMIKSVEKAMRILDHVSEHGTGMPVRLGSIAQAVDMHPSTCARLLATLCASDYLEKVSRTEGYLLGPKAYLLASRRPYRMDLLRIAIPHMLELCNKVQENVSLSAYHRGSLYVAYSAFYEDEGIRRRGTTRGTLYSSAGGRVILAHMDPLERRQVFETRGYPTASEWPAAVSPQLLEEELSRIRQDGYCVSHPSTQEYSAVSCPLWSTDNRVREAMGVYMLSERFAGEKREKAIYEVQLTAYLINKKLTGAIR